MGSGWGKHLSIVLNADTDFRVAIDGCSNGMGVTYCSSKNFTHPDDFIPEIFLGDARFANDSF